MSKEKVLEQLELVDVENDGKKAVMIFLDEENGEIRQVQFNKQKYDKDKEEFVDDEEKAGKVEEWCKEYFNVSFDKLGSAVGDKKDVYAYDKFNSLWQVKMVEKFTKDEEGTLINTKVANAFDDGIGIHIEFEYEGDIYESKMMYSQFLESKSQFFPNPQKKESQYKKLQDKFGVEKPEDLNGKEIVVEVKVAFGKYPYAEIKPFPKAKK